MPKTTNTRKPNLPAKHKNYTVPVTARNIEKGVLNASASEWTSPSKIISAMDASIIQNSDSNDIFNRLLKTFTNLNKTSSETAIKNYALNCFKYASQDKFKQEFVDIVEARKLKIRDLVVEKRIHDLANQGMDGALTIASSSMTQVVSRALDVVNNNDRIITETEESENEEEEENGSDEDERVWNEILSSSKRTAINPPGESQYTPEKPKLTPKMIKELEPSCHLALSCIPLSQIPADLIPKFHQYKDDDFKLKSLKTETDMFNRLCCLVDVDDTKENRDNYGLFIWQCEMEARTKKESNAELLKVFCFCLTDFWSSCFQEDFRKDHERTFWVENIVPKFKYLGSNENIIFSWCEDHVKSYQDDQVEKNFWLNSTSNCFSDGVGRINNGQEILLMESSSGYQEEDLEHSLGDTYKLIKLTTASLHEILKRKQDCKASSASKLAVFGIQCIKDKLTLIKTTFDSKLENYEVMELRSCTIPTAWKSRFGMLKVFELLACLHFELKEQQQLERELLKQQNQIVVVNAEESVRYVLRSGRLDRYFS